MKGTTVTKSGEGKGSKESQQANSKMGDFGPYPKFWGGKINPHKGRKEKKKKGNSTNQQKNKAQNFLQSIQTKSKHPSLTW